jgi:hypothetical protein
VKEAEEVLKLAQSKTDPLDVRLMAEQWLLTHDKSAASHLFKTLNAFPTTAQEIAAEFSNVGLWRDGAEVLDQSVAAAPDKSKISPMIYYYLGDFAEKLGDTAKAADCQAGDGAIAGLCFPVPIRSHSSFALRDGRKSFRRPRALLSRQSAVRLAAGRGGCALGKIRRA